MINLSRSNLLLPLLEQLPVPVDWPKRVGYPPPGVTRKTAYPAGEGIKIGKKKKKKRRRQKRKGHTEENSSLKYPTHDAEYPCNPDGKKIAKSHAWQFPSKRIKVCGKILKV